MRKRDERQNRADPKFCRAIPYIKNVSVAVSRLLAPLGVGDTYRPEATMRRQVMRPKAQCHGKKHLESFTGSGVVADKATTSEKLEDCSERELPNTRQRIWQSRPSSYAYEANTLKQRIVVEHAQVLQLLKFCLRTYFTFYGTIYEQVKGTPMGSPTTGFIAEAVLQRLESLVFQHHRPKFWARYVDDTFVVIERDQALTFKERLNSVFPDIQFMVEGEENNQLAFLDVLVCCKDCGGLKTKGSSNKYEKEHLPQHHWLKLPERQEAMSLYKWFPESYANTSVELVPENLTLLQGLRSVSCPGPIKADNFEHAMLVQQLVVGLREEKARENLLSEKKDLSWEKACDIVSHQERVRQNLQQLNQPNDGVIASLESEMAVSLVNTAVS
nr:unnamed protein product [Spirometra erinaceieuropaei]